jgi:hypothetical protein
MIIASASGLISAVCAIITEFAVTDTGPFQGIYSGSNFINMRLTDFNHISHNGIVRPTGSRGVIRGASHGVSIRHRSPKIINMLFTNFGYISLQSIFKTVIIRRSLIPTLPFSVNRGP